MNSLFILPALFFKSHVYYILQFTLERASVFSPQIFRLRFYTLVLCDIPHKFSSLVCTIYVCPVNPTHRLDYVQHLMPTYVYYVNETRSR
jgi:hypothetical protein